MTDGPIRPEMGGGLALCVSLHFLSHSLRLINPSNDRDHNTDADHHPDERTTMVTTILMITTNDRRTRPHPDRPLSPCERTAARAADQPYIDEIEPRFQSGV